MSTQPYFRLSSWSIDSTVSFHQLYNLFRFYSDRNCTCIHMAFDHTECIHLSYLTVYGWLIIMYICMWWGASKLLVSLVSRILRNSPSAWLILLLLPLPWTLTSNNHDHYPRRGMTHNSSGCSTIQSPNLHGGVKIQLATYNAIMWTSINGSLLTYS